MRAEGRNALLLTPRGARTMSHLPDPSRNSGFRRQRRAGATGFQRRNRGLSGARDVDALQKRAGGRIGFSARVHGERRALAFQPDQLFPMCSTHKFISVAALLALVDSGKRDLRQFIRYSEKDIQSYAPVAKHHLREGGMYLSAICAAAIQQSDNCAANILSCGN
ncbi:MAG: serine hydrolase [Acetobacteraceae bacterium]